MIAPPDRWRILMPTFDVSPDGQLHYLVDDFTEPWTEPETIVLLHGNAESSRAWYAWVPLLARRFRVVRPDMRGYGASTPMPRDFTWSLDVIIDDYARLLDSLGAQRFHLVGAKIGGIIARAFAARRPERVTTLTVIGSPPPSAPGRRAHPGADRRVRDAGGRALGAADHGRPARRSLSCRGGRVVDPLHGPDARVDDRRLQCRDQLLGHPGRSAEDRLPHAGGDHRRERPRVGRTTRTGSRRSGTPSSW